MDKQTLGGIDPAVLRAFGFAGACGAQAVAPKRPDDASGGVLARAGVAAIAPGASVPAGAAPVDGGVDDRPPGATAHGAEGERAPS